MTFPRGFGYRRAPVDAHVASQERAVAALGAEVERLRGADPLTGASNEVTGMIATFARVVADLRASAEREAMSVRRAAEDDAARVRAEAARLFDNERARATLVAEDILRRARHEIELMTRTQDRVDQALNEAAEGIVSMIDLFDHLRLPGAPRRPAAPPTEIDLRDPPPAVEAPRGPAEGGNRPTTGQPAEATAADPREGGSAGIVRGGGPVAAAEWQPPDPATRVVEPDTGSDPRTRLVEPDARPDPGTRVVGPDTRPGPPAPGPAFRRMPPDRARLARPPDPLSAEVRRAPAEVRRRDETATPFDAVAFDPRNGRVVEFDPPADDAPS